MENVRVLKDEIINAKSGFSIERFAVALLEKFGKEEGLAEKAFEEFAAAESGSNTRKALLEMVFKTLINAAPGLTAGDDIPVEDIEARLKALLHGTG